jgi:hypothetical protein
MSVVLVHKVGFFIYMPPSIRSMVTVVLGAQPIRT